MPPPPLPSFSSILCAPSLSSSSATSVFSVSHPFDSSSNVLFALSVFISDNFSLVVVVVVVVVLSSSSFSFFSRSYVNSSICSFLLAIFNTIRPSLANRRRRSCASSSSSSSSSTFSLSPPTTANRIASFSPPATTARIASSSSPSRVRSHCESRSRSVSSRSALVNVVVVVGLASNSPPPRVVGVGDGDDCIIDGRTTTPAMFSNDIFVSLSLKSLFTLSLSLTASSSFTSSSFSLKGGGPKERQKPPPLPPRSSLVVLEKIPCTRLLEALSLLVVESSLSLLLLCGII